MEQISIIKYEVHLPTSQEIAVDKRTEGEFVTRLAWSDQYTLYMSQGDNVKICKIKKRSDPIEILRQRDLPGHLVEIVSAFKLRDRAEDECVSDNSNVERKFFKFSLLYLFLHFGAIMVETRTNITWPGF